jgi:pyruvate/2-oxoglutarate dehydrogenase complex dihydrolipoamide dehydrogenase (E3) component
VALVERDKIGGTCLNYGCDPTKTMLHIANLLYHAQHADQFGIHNLDAKVEWPAVMARVQQVIDRIRGATADEAAKELTHKGIDVMVGEAVFVSPHELTIAGKSVSAAHIVIATGCQNIVPAIEGLDEVGFISNVEAVSLPTLPRSLAIVGATSGLVKLLVDKQGLLLGGHVLAPHAGDLLAPIILAMRTGITAEMLASTIMPYPTMVEGYGGQRIGCKLIKSVICLLAKGIT